MSVQDDIKPLKIVTPKGEAIWPKLDEPDTKFNAAGEYSVKLKLSGEDAEELKAQVDKFVDEVEQATQAQLDDEISSAPGPKKAKLKKVKEELTTNYPYDMDVDDDGMETGDVIFKFKMVASGENKRTGKAWERKPALFDSKGKPFPEGVAIWNGSTLRVSGVMTPYFVPAMKFCGGSLKLNAVKVIDLVSGGGASSAAGFGFGGEEEGIDADEVEAPVSKNNNNNDSDEDYGSDSSEEEESADF